MFKKIRDSFNKLGSSDKISSFSVAVTVLALILSVFTGSFSYFGYKINKSINERSKTEWNIQQSKHRRDFWREIELVEQSIYNQMKQIGKNMGVYQARYSMILDHIERLQYANVSLKIDGQHYQDMKYILAYMELTASYASLVGSIENIAVKYDNSVLINDHLVDVLGVKCWSLYLNQANKFKAWRKNITESYNESYNLIHSITETGIMPEDFEEKVIKLSDDIGESYLKISPPSLVGVKLLREANHPGKKLIKNTDEYCKSI